jgi:probable HAF family extracellular repeat protein
VDQRALNHALARFEVKSSLPSSIPEDCVQEYHAIVDALSAATDEALDAFQAVGSSGNCAMPFLHALLWNRRHEAESRNEDRVHFTVTNLGNLGGTGGNLPFDINNQGSVVGVSTLPDDTTSHAFLWTQDNGIKDLGTLPGDLLSVAYGINSEDQVVGTSIDAEGDARAFLRQSGVVTDLNTLIPARSSLFLLDAFAIDDRGDIVGDAFSTSSGEVHAYLATPCDEEQSDNDGCKATTRGADSSQRPKVILPDNVRKLLSQRLGHH